MSSNPVMFCLWILSVICLIKYGDTYPKGVCICQFDSYLQVVHDKLMNNKTTVYVPPPPPPVVTTVDSDSTMTTAASATTNSDGTVATATGTTDGTTNDQTTATTNEAGTSQTTIAATTAETTEATTTPATVTENATPAAQNEVQRRKREVYLETENNGVPSPLSGIVYGGSLELSETYGVNFSDTYESSNCSCVVKGIATLKLCLTDVEYDEEKYGDPTSSESRDILSRIVPKIHEILMTESLTKDSYIRLIFNGFSSYNKHIMTMFTVYFNEYDDLLAYMVQQAMEVKMRGNKLAGYTTDANPKKMCLQVADITPEKDAEDILSFYVYIIGAAAAVLVILVIVVLCFGKRDAFYLRFW